MLACVTARLPARCDVSVVASIALWGRAADNCITSRQGLYFHTLMFERLSVPESGSDYVYR